MSQAYLDMPDAKRRIKAIFVGSMGNLVEWYDFYAYTAFALYFAPAFFPSHDPVVQQLNAATLFAAGFIVRPLGGWLFGHLADRHGRRLSLMVSVGMMCVDDNPAADQTAQDTLGEIAHSVGFTDIEFQFEPLAAAFDYESQIDREELVLVIDIGGGTSDFSLIRLGPGRAAKPDRREDILAYGGVHIGGVDFDKQLSLAHVMLLLGLGSQLRSGKDVPSTQYGNLACWHTINQAYTRKAAEHFAYIRAEAGDRDKIDLLLNLVKQRAGHWVAVQVEEAKIALSEGPAARIDLSRIAPELGVEVTRPSFDTSVARLIEKIEQTVGTLLRDAGVAPVDVDTVFFTGGSSRVPRLRDCVSALVPQARSVEGDLFGSIGAGLALDARRKFD